MLIWWQYSNVQEIHVLAYLSKPSSLTLSMAFFALLPDWQWKMRFSSFTCGFRTPYFCSNSAGFKLNASTTCDTEKIKINWIIEGGSVTIDSGSWKGDVTFLNIDEILSYCAYHRRKSLYPEIVTDLTIEIYQIFPTTTYKVCSQTLVFFPLRQVRVALWHQTVVYHHL